MHKLWITKLRVALSSARGNPLKRKQKRERKPTTTKQDPMQRIDIYDWRKNAPKTDWCQCFSLQKFPPMDQMFVCTVCIEENIGNFIIWECLFPSKTHTAPPPHTHSTLQCLGTGSCWLCTQLGTQVLGMKARSAAYMASTLPMCYLSGPWNLCCLPGEFAIAAQGN